MKKTSKFILGEIVLETVFWLGGIIGFIAGILYAKRSGEELRAQLKGKKASEGSKILGEEMKSVGKELLDGVAEMIKK